jgi:hypothetical protein
MTRLLLALLVVLAITPAHATECSELALHAIRILNKNGPEFVAVACDNVVDDARVGCRCHWLRQWQRWLRNERRRMDAVRRAKRCLRGQVSQ